MELEPQLIWLVNKKSLLRVVSLLLLLLHASSCTSNNNLGPFSPVPAGMSSVAVADKENFRSVLRNMEINNFFINRPSLQSAMEDVEFLVNEQLSVPEKIVFIVIPANGSEINHSFFKEENKSFLQQFESILDKFEADYWFYDNYVIVSNLPVVVEGVNEGALTLDVIVNSMEEWGKHKEIFKDKNQDSVFERIERQDAVKPIF